VCTGSGGARAAALALWALATGGGGLGAAGVGLDAPLERFAGRCCVGATLASELPYPARRAPRRFLVVRAARERCGACLGVPVPLRGCSGVGAASDGAGRRAPRLRGAVGVCAVAPAARALLRLVSGRLRRLGTGWARLARGSLRLGKALRSGATWVPHFASELPYPDRRAPRRFLVIRAALQRCGARLGVPATRRGSFGLGVASDGVWRGRRTLRRVVGDTRVGLTQPRRYKNLRKRPFIES
jgi:hypothetical protein